MLAVHEAVIVGAQPRWRMAGLAGKGHTRNGLNPMILQSLDGLLALMPEATLVVDQAGHIRSANASAARLFGYTETELVGQIVEILIPELFHSSHPSQRQKFHGERALGADASLLGRRKDGSEFDVDVLLRSVRTAEGPQVVAVIRNASQDAALITALRDRETANRGILEAIPDMLYRMDGNGIYLEVWPGVTATPHSDPRELVQRSVRDVLPPEVAEEFMRSITLALSTGHPQTAAYELRNGADNDYYEARISAVSEGEVVALVRDVTESRRTSKLLAGQAHILETMATGKAFEEIMEELALMAEAQTAGTLGCIFLVDSSDSKLRLCAAPSLPDSLRDAIAPGLPVGPNSGCGGLAAHRREFVVSTDVPNDPIWSDYHERTTKHGLRACWSSPIFSTGRQAVVGALDIFVHQEGNPNSHEEKVIQAIVRLAENAISRMRVEEAMVRAREELDAATQLKTEKAATYRITFREHSVLTLLAAGQADKEIAATLGISTNTVRKHVKSILLKMDATSRTEAGVKAVREGLVD